jgi:hypothetical protein
VCRREYRCVPVLVGLLGLVVLRRVLGLCRILSAFHPHLYQRPVATYWPLRRLEVNNLSRLRDLQSSLAVKCRPILRTRLSEWPWRRTGLFMLRNFTSRPFLDSSRYNKEPSEVYSHKI